MMNIAITNGSQRPNLVPRWTSGMHTSRVSAMKRHALQSLLELPDMSDLSRAVTKHLRVVCRATAHVMKRQKYLVSEDAEKDRHERDDEMLRAILNEASKI